MHKLRTNCKLVRFNEKNCLQNTLADSQDKSLKLFFLCLTLSFAAIFC